MRTDDLIKRGINRNFLRECERQGILHPRRIDSESIVDKKYKPREYSESDIKIIWGSHLLHKIGFSYEEIKKWWNGEIISLRPPINKRIENAEKQIEELEALIKFMKYVKGIGILPEPPSTAQNVDNFKDYINSYMNDLDPKGELIKCLERICYFNEPQNTESPEYKKRVHEVEKTFKKALSKFSDDEKSHLEMCGKFIFDLSELKKHNIHPSSVEVQQKICNIYDYLKLNVLANVSSCTPASFCVITIEFLLRDSDISEGIRKDIGEENVKFICNALLETAENFV